MVTRVHVVYSWVVFKFHSNYFEQLYEDEISIFTAFAHGNAGSGLLWL